MIPGPREVHALSKVPFVWSAFKGITSAVPPNRHLQGIHLICIYLEILSLASLFPNGQVRWWHSRNSRFHNSLISKFYSSCIHIYGYIMQTCKTQDSPLWYRVRPPQWLMIRRGTHENDSRFTTTRLLTQSTPSSTLYVVFGWGGGGGA